MRPLKKSLLLIVIVLMVTLAVLFAGGYLWINSRMGCHWLQAQIDAAIPGSISIGTQRLSLLPLGVDLKDVVLHDAQGQPLAGIALLTLRLAWRPLLQREVRVETLRLDTPWAELTQDDAGLDLMRALLSPELEDDTPQENRGVSLPVNITCQDLQLTGGRLVFSAPGSGLHLSAGGMTLSASGDLMARQAEIDFQAQPLDVTSGDIHPQPASLHLKARLDGDRLAVPDLAVHSGQTTLHLRASTDRLDLDPVVDGQLTLQSELAEWKEVFNLAGTYAGQLTGQLDLKGRLGNPDARLVLAIGSGQAAGQPFDRVELTAAIADRQTTIGPAFWQLANGRLDIGGTVDLHDAFKKGFLTPPSDLDAIAYALTLTQRMPDIAPWLKSVAAVSGRMESRLTLTGRGARPQASTARLDLNSRVQSLSAAGMDRPVSATATLAARLTPEAMTLENLHLVADGLTLAGKGHYGREDQSLTGNLDLSAENLSRTLAVVGQGALNGAVEAAIRVGGRLSQPQCAVRMAANGLRTGIYTLGDVNVDADLTPDGQLTLQRLDVRNQASHITGSGRLRLLADRGGVDPDFTNHLTLKVDRAVVDRFMDAPPVDGQLDAELSLTGPLTALEGTLRLAGKGLRRADMPIGNVTARLGLDKGMIRVEALDVVNRGARLGASGTIGLFKPGTIRLAGDPDLDLKLRFRDFNPAIFSDQVKGRFNLDGALDGPISAPVGRFSVAGSAIALAGQPVSAISIDARFENRRIWLDRLVAALTADQRLVAGGSVGIDKTMDLQLMSDGIRLESIKPLQTQLPATGLLRLGLSAKGSIDDPDIDGQLTVREVHLNDEPIADIDLTLALHDNVARLTGNLNFAVDAAYDLREGDFKGVFTFDRTETAAYFRALGRPEFHGTLSGQITAAGNRDTMADAAIHADLDGLDLYWDKTPLVQSQRIVVHLSQGRLTIPDSTLTLLRQGHLRIKGDAQMNGELDITLGGRIPLATMRAFSDDLADATGVLTLDGRVTGKLDQPQVDARLALEKVAMTVPGLDQQLHDLGGRIQLTPTAIHFEEIRGDLDTGTFTLSGSIAHDAFTPKGVDLVIAARALPVEVPETLNLLLNGDIHITGRDRKAAARGQLVLLEGTYYKDVNINLLKMATSRERSVSPAASPLSVPYFDTVDLDIDVTHRQSFLVENNLADLEISPDLAIGGTLARPIISGRAQVTNGTVNFQRRTFTVNKGIIDFVNPYKTEADIDIESQTTIRDWTIILAIQGTLDNLKLDLSSEPSETDSDILSLILFGRTGSELTGGTGGSRRTSSQIVAEMIADTFGEDIKRYAGVDILQVETDNVDDNGNTSDVKVTVGKHLSNRMTLKYAVETTDGKVTQRAISEYKLLENILVSGFQDSEGVYGTELSFRIEFR